MPKILNNQTRPASLSEIDESQTQSQPDELMKSQMPPAKKILLNTFVDPTEQPQNP